MQVSWPLYGLLSGDEVAAVLARWNQKEGMAFRINHKIY